MRGAIRNRFRYGAEGLMNLIACALACPEHTDLPCILTGDPQVELTEEELNEIRKSPEAGSTDSISWRRGYGPMYTIQRHRPVNASQARNASACSPFHFSPSPLGNRSGNVEHEYQHCSPGLRFSGTSMAERMTLGHPAPIFDGCPVASQANSGSSKRSRNDNVDNEDRASSKRSRSPEPERYAGSAEVPFERSVESPRDSEARWSSNKRSREDDGCQSSRNRKMKRPKSSDLA